MKKSTAKASAKTPAPAKKAAVKTVKKTAAAPAKKAPSAAPAPVAPAPVTKTAPAVKKASSAAFTTTITAAVDVGYGNALYIRGEGPGLNWERGVLLDCVADDRWTITLSATDKPILCKLLLNDVAWSIGNDYLIPAGSDVTLTPTF